uniref:SCP domain-containing protein n=1 Tax=Mesocestoides corti TaxID=53468 RepID=A0A5K3FL23_MESCO
MKGTRQNLAITTANPPNWTAMAQRRYDEAEDYDFDTRKSNRTCGHCTHMVWTTSSEVGCAAYQRGKIKPTWKPPICLLICRYKPA